MQCRNCQFENMPGIEYCGRCGASLQIASAAIDVHPPRASRQAKFWRKCLPTHRVAPRRLLDSCLGRVKQFFGEVETDRDAASVFRRMTVPGWPQIYCNQSLRGRTLLFGYLGLMLTGLLFIGTTAGSLLLGLAFSCHMSSVVDVIHSGSREWRTRISYSLLSFLAIAGCVYFPIGWLISRVAVPQVINLDAPPFQAGDVILYNPSAYRNAPPAVGEVVVYDVANIQITDQDTNRVYAIQGAHIDRILAGPGQRIKSQNRLLTIDGQPSPWRPLNQSALPANVDVTVPEGQFFIFPSTDHVLMNGAQAAVWLAVSSVPLARISGRVYLRHQPLSRFSLVR